MKTLQNIVIQAEKSTVEASVGEGKRPKFDVVAYNGGPLTVGGYDLPIVLDLSGLEQGKSVIANLQTAQENQSAARGRIMDADFAAETANLSRGQILQQAGMAMLTQANAMPQQVLSLLRG